MSDNPGWSLLTKRQAAAARPFLAERETERRHIVVYLSGAHAYGFPSPDSDLDLKAVHLAPAEDACRLHPSLGNAEKTVFAPVPDGADVELDYSSNELGAVLLGCLKGNGNFLERLLGTASLLEAPQLAELRPLLRKNLTSQVQHHYRGFAFRLLEEAKSARTAKKFLYVVRACLTGAHLLETGSMVTNVTELAPDRGFADLEELLAIKRTGEVAPLADAHAAHWEERCAAARLVLEAACERTILPSAPSAAEDLNAWFVEARLGFRAKGPR